MTLTNEDLAVLDDADISDNAPSVIPAPRESSQNNLPVVATNFLSNLNPVNLNITECKEIEGKANRSILRQELENYDIYLHNIHEGFKSATSIFALSRLVRDGLMINKQRRASIEHAMKLKPESALVPQYDVMGKEIKE